MVSILLFKKPIQFYSIDTSLFIFFAIGGFSAYVNWRYAIPDSIIKNKFISSLAFLAVVSTIFYPRTFDSVHLALISLFFILVVLGNDMFGIFSLKSSVLLGEISYSIYLLHGVVLYLAFSVFDIASIETFSLQEYLIFMPLISVSVIFMSASTFILIEKPSMNFGRKYMLSSMLLPVIGHANRARESPHESPLRQHPASDSAQGSSTSRSKH